MDDGYPYYPDPCTEPGHAWGCSGKAGGEHLPDVQPAKAMTDVARLALGKMVLDRFITSDEVDDWPAHQAQATTWLEGLGFGRVEWVQGSLDDVLLLLLWRYEEPGDELSFGLRLIDEFIIKYSGFDAAIIGVFNLVAEEEV